MHFVDRQRRVGETLLALAQALAVPVDDRAPVEHDGPLEQARHGAAAGVDPAPVLEGHGSRLPWYSRSVDSTYLTDKRVFIFGDATHALAAARVAAGELGFRVVGLGTYAREFAREVRAEAALHGIEATITDDYLDVEAAIQAAQPELVLGTQMERHIAKRLGLPCAVISAPVHVQDFPARRSPQMGFEGANVLFDTWVHPLMMGLEEHLLGMFREDAEFHAEAAPSHLGRSAPTLPDEAPSRTPVVPASETGFPSPDPLRGPPYSRGGEKDPATGSNGRPYRSCTLSTTSRNFASTPSRFSAFTTPTARR